MRWYDVWECAWAGFAGGWAWWRWNRPVAFLPGPSGAYNSNNMIEMAWDVPIAMLDESVWTKADDGSPLRYDRVDVSAAAVGHVDIDVVCTRKVVGVGATSTSSGWDCRRSTFGEMIRPFIYHDRNLTTRLENKRLRNSAVTLVHRRLRGVKRPSSGI